MASSPPPPPPRVPRIYGNTVDPLLDTIRDFAKEGEDALRNKDFASALVYFKELAAILEERNRGSIQSPERSTEALVNNEGTNPEAARDENDWVLTYWLAVACLLVAWIAVAFAIEAAFNAAKNLWI